MGQNELILVGMFVLPIVVLFFLRANATFVFLSLAAGYVLTQFLGSDIYSFADLFFGHAKVSSNMLELGLLLAPPILTTIFMVRTVKGSRAMLNVLPAAAVGCLVALASVPLLSPGLSHAVMNVVLWGQITKLQSFIVGASVLVVLFFLWMQRPKHGKEKKSSKRD